MKFVGAVLVLSSLTLAGSISNARDREEPRIVPTTTPLPIAIDKDFQFRKTKLLHLSDKAHQGQGARQTTSTLNKKSGSGGAQDQKTATLQDAPITFERQYRLFGA